MNEKETSRGAGRKTIFERVKARRWTIAWYFFLTACGILLYLLGHAAATAERGYIAYGGETLILLLPLLYKLFSSIVRDWTLDIKNDLEDSNDEREHERIHG